MDPMTIGMVAMAGLTAGGTAMQVKGQLDQADTYSRLADIDTEVQYQQSSFAEEQGQQIAQEGFEQAKEIRSAGTRLQADQRATVGAAGLKADTGSPLLLAMESARATELDAITTEYEGQRGKVLSQRQSDEFKRQAALTKYDKLLNKRAASQAAAGTVLGSVMKIAQPFVGGLGPSLA